MARASWCAVRTDLCSAIYGWEAPSEQRLSRLDVAGRPRNISLVNAYAPTEDSDEDIKDAFYASLKALLAATPAGATVIFVGDFNAKVGRDAACRIVAGIHSLHAVPSDNEMRLVQFTAGHDLVIKSTMESRRNIQKFTWFSNDGVTRNQIDHVLVRSCDRSAVRGNTMDKPGCSKDQDGPVDSDIEFASSDSSWTDEVEGQDLDSRKQLMEDFFEYLQKFHRPKRKRSNSKNTQKNEGEELENKKKSHKKKKSHEKKKPHNEKKSKKKEDGEEDGSILQKEVDFTDTNHGAQMLNALGDVRENNASTAPVPRNEAGPSTTRNFPSTAIDDSSTTGHGQLAPEGNNVVPVKTGEKTSVGEVRIDNSTQREQLLLQADVRSVGFDSNQFVPVIFSTTPVPHNEAGSSATAYFPNTANNDSSTTSHGRMAPGERDLAKDLALAASKALKELPLEWFPAINPSQVAVSETSLGRLGLLTCPMCSIKIQSKYRPTFKGKEWSTLGVTKHIPLCIIEKLIRKVCLKEKPSDSDIILVLGLKG